MMPQPGADRSSAPLIMADRQLLAQLATARQHVLRAVDGLPEDAMHRTFVPSGWSITRLLNHLAYDDEMFWISAILGGDPRAIEALHDGWASDPMTGAAAIDVYTREIERSDRVLRRADLDAPPVWTPPASIFGAPPMRNGRAVVLRVLEETSVHAGHLDIVRELVDGHQNLVITPPPDFVPPVSSPTARSRLRAGRGPGSRSGD